MNGKKEIKISNLVLLICLAFVSAVGIFEFKINANNSSMDEWISRKNFLVIACGANQFTKYNNDEIAMDQQPGNKENGNNCSHQQFSICETNYSKRKNLKQHLC